MKIFVALFLLFSQYALATENSHYPLIEISGISPIHKYIGRMINVQAAVCTVTLISDKLAITAAHCVNDFSPRREKEKIEGNQWMYCARAKCPTVSFPFLNVTSSFDIDKVIKGGVNFRLSSFEFGIGNDWAILVLDTKSEIMPANYPKFKNVSFNELEEITIIGYPAYDHTKMYSSICHPQSIYSANVIEYPCSTSGGISGAPITILNENEYFIVGIHIRGGSQLLNAGIHFNKEIFTRIKDLTDNITPRFKSISSTNNQIYL